MKLYGLTTLNIELTNRCNKKCHFCGRRQIEKTDPELAIYNNDIDFKLLERIAKQLPPNITVALHNNGESLLFPRFGEAVKLFKDQITTVVTNGKLIVEKADEIIDNLDTMAISVIEKDMETREQFKIIEEFLKIKGDRKPHTILRMNGEVNDKVYKEHFELPMAKRLIHSPMGSFNYKKKDPTVPEAGICWDFLGHLAINSYGDVSPCVRFDPHRLGVLGNIKYETLEEIWNGRLRQKWLRHHVEGKRDKIELCKTCQFWGVPTGS